MPEDTQKSLLGPGKLYVFIHGNIVLVERPNELLAVVIEMGEEHSYRAGNWLTELPVPYGTQTELTGVLAGDAGLSPLETVLHGVQLIADSPLIHATFKLPKPRVPVHAFRRAAHTAADLTFGIGTAARATGEVAGIRIIEYDFDEVADLALQGFNWQTALFSVDKRVTTLHLIAEPEGQVSANHTRDEFAKGAQIFHGVQVTLNNSLRLGGIEDEYPKAVLPVAEVATLLERRDLLAGVAASIRLNDATLIGGVEGGGPGGELCGDLSAVES